MLTNRSHTYKGMVHQYIDQRANTVLDYDNKDNLELMAAYETDKNELIWIGKINCGSQSLNNQYKKISHL
ncbi:hypothetical protein JCM9140_4840 [Halalkalibacter wakoensis JCM 9140]|uniref:Uncharacterized protein n=1 Tax=Halalkalibacter wakoensis JCM 9140 TaxID=1236970 RepID=W4Q9E5_9BACI|nr:hypothetical protein JCM9140_4840 [Halalkalibacter wakoensis JCM 9140]